ncbi:MAG: thiol reductant ABC exporter subunit CydD [Bacteroidota bacterium]
MKRRPPSEKIGKLHRRLFGLAAPHGKAFRVLGALCIVLAVAVIAQMFFLGSAIVAVTERSVAPPSLATPLVITFAALTIRAVTSWGISVVARSIGIAVMQALRMKLFDHLARLGPAFLVRERTGELVNTATAGVDKLDAYYGDFLPQAVQTLILPGVICLFVFWMDTLSGLVLLVTGPLIPVFMWLIGTWTEHKSRRQWTHLSRLSAHYLDVLQGLRTLKLFGRDRRQTEHIRQVSDAFRRSTMDVLKVAFLSGLVLELAASVSVALVAVQAGVRLIEGLITFEHAMVVLLLAPEFYLPFRRLGAHHHAGMEGVAAAERIFAIIDAPPKQIFNRFESGLQGPGASPAITFENVAYRYPERDRPALVDVSFRIDAGSTYALVGPSGAGKSTVAALLLGFVAPTSGSIKIDDVPLADFPADYWRRQVAYVSQQPFLFQGTLLSNLRAARPRASRAEIVAAMEALGLAGLLKELPDGLDTTVGERGHTLSGGQRQRVALLRAWLKQSPVVVLDEPTAHLDPELQSTLDDAVERLLPGRTVLIITHRIETAAKADAVVELHHGRVVSEGRHEQLIASSASYAMMALQRPYAP